LKVELFCQYIALTNIKGFKSGKALIKERGRLAHEWMNCESAEPHATSLLPHIGEADNSVRPSTVFGARNPVTIFWVSAVTGLGIWSGSTVTTQIRLRRDSAGSVGRVNDRVGVLTLARTPEVQSASVTRAAAPAKKSKVGFPINLVLGVGSWGGTTEAFPAPAGPSTDLPRWKGADKIFLHPPTAKDNPET